MKKYLKKGIITISLGTLLAVSGVIGTCVVTFFNVTGNNRERVVVLEEAVSTMKEDMSEIKSDIKILIQRK